MNRINHKIYLMAANEVLINGNSQIDLGTHILECSTGFAEIGQGDMYHGDACLAFLVRLKNKNTGFIEWGNIYYKRLIKDSDVVSQKAKLTALFNQLIESSYEEKIGFILRAENKLTKTPYAKSIYVNPCLASYFENLNGQSAFDGYPAVSIGGKFPSAVIPSLENTFYNTVNEDLFGDRKRKQR